MDKSTKITLDIIVTSEYRKAIAWNINDSKPLTDTELFTYFANLIEKDRDELLH